MSNTGATAPIAAAIHSSVRRRRSDHLRLLTDLRSKLTRELVTTVTARNQTLWLPVGPTARRSGEKTRPLTH